MEKFNIGDKVIYHSVLGHSEFDIVTTIISETWELANGEELVKVHGVSGGVGVEYLTKI